MPRTIESIIDNHHAATERREAGQPIWDRKLRIKQYFAGSNATDETAKDTARNISHTLKNSSWAKTDQKEAGIDSEVIQLAEEFGDVEDLATLNSLLDTLYDLADADRVWIG